MSNNAYVPYEKAIGKAADELTSAILVPLNLSGDESVRIAAVINGGFKRLADVIIDEAVKEAKERALLAETTKEQQSQNETSPPKNRRACFVFGATVLERNGYNRAEAGCAAI